VNKPKTREHGISSVVIDSILIPEKKQNNDYSILLLELLSLLLVLLQKDRPLRNIEDTLV